MDENMRQKLVLSCTYVYNLNKWVRKKKLQILFSCLSTLDTSDLRTFELTSAYNWESK